MNNPPKISVIIPTFNRAQMVCDCVASVLATGYPSLEVIVVDDCSPDDTGRKIKDRFQEDGRVRYLRNERNSFQAVSRNNGVRASSGEYLFILDDDNLVDKSIFTELLACFARHAHAGLVAPLSVHQRPGKENLIWTLGSDFSRWTSRPKDCGNNLPFAELPAEPLDYPTTYSPNAFMVPRNVYEKLGGMEESFVQIFEESDFGWRVCENGYSAWIATRARTDHLGFLETGCVPELRMLGIEKPYRTYCFACNRLRFARRHFNFLQILSVTFIFAPLSVAYYGLVALRNHRPDIAWAYLRGTLIGIGEIFLCRVSVSCAKKRYVLSYAHASKPCTTENDQRNVRGRVYPFAERREQVLADLGRMRMLAKELSAELLRVVQHGEGASVREVSSALVRAAKKVGCYVPYERRSTFGDLKCRRSGESEVFSGLDYGWLVKFKDPDAKQAIKRTTPSDWLYEHVIHNILFPEARYEFLGVSECSGMVRIVLKQKNLATVTFPSDDQVSAALLELGLKLEDRYFYGNAVLAVTDVGSRGDNVLLSDEGRLFFIDPLIRLKCPALDVIKWLVGPWNEKEGL